MTLVGRGASNGGVALPAGDTGAYGEAVVLLLDASLGGVLVHGLEEVIDELCRVPVSVQ